MGDTFRVFWRDIEIGVFEVTDTDMWYSEGAFLPHCSDFTNAFVKLASAFNAAEVMKNAEKGTRIILKNDISSDSTHALVISLDNDSLFVRQVLEAKAVEWLIKNVK